MNSPGERRIYPPQEYRKLLDTLVDELQIFERKQKALMFAAALGASRGKQEPVSTRGEGIRIDIFQRGVDDTFIDALAVVVTGDLHVLATDRREERITIFEESASAGLKEIQKLIDKPSDSLEELLRLTQDARAPSRQDLPGIEPDALARLENF